MEMEATGAPQNHHHTLNQQVGSITNSINYLLFNMCQHKNQNGKS
ncbi:Uncharacterised protein [Escherichia coli]|nr:hypothetical protein WCM_03201 [Escherichia coli KTE10]STJ57911.1 Uncharacterised protein [Escherichia coli]VVY75981.1 Uncharacterised protein [Escherichia coli]VWN04734.1 Uncharacterised protein [Escherichia coli]